MSQTVSTLLLRNLHDVFGEIDPVHRRATIDEIFHEDAVFHEPNGIYRGCDEIHRIAGVIKAMHPDFRYQPLSPPEEVGDGGRVQWVSGSPGKPPEYAGTDFIIARDGKIVEPHRQFIIAARQRHVDAHRQEQRNDPSALLVNAACGDVPDPCAVRGDRGSA